MALPSHHDANDNNAPNQSLPPIAEVSCEISSSQFLTAAAYSKSKGNDKPMQINSNGHGHSGDSGFYTADEEETPALDANNHNHNNSKALSHLRLIVTLIGLLTGFILCFFMTLNDNPHINQTLGIALWMATLWLTELVPLVVTAFLPLILFPLFGILSSATVASQYMNNTIWLLIAGFLVALTLERWGLHRRFSLKILTWCGTRPPFLLLGMMTATFLLSMFVSNTATTLMMVPNAISVCTVLEEAEREDSDKEAETEDDCNNNHRRSNRQQQSFAHALLLGIAYAANVGGMSSLIGTAPNLVFHRQLELLFPQAPEFTFAHWIAFGLPTGMVLFGMIWAYLCVKYLRGSFLTTGRRRPANDEHQAVDPNLFRQTYLALGDWSREQVTVCVLFFALCLLWIFRSDIELGASFRIPGWANLFPEPSYISDATTGMVIVLILFVCPARSCHLDNHNDNKKKHKAKVDDAAMGEDEEVASATTPTSNDNNTIHHDNPDTPNDTTLLDWDTANKMPYDVVFLLGGGFALAKAFVESGLSEFLGEELASLHLSVPSLIFLLITMIIWLTELTSNTSTSNIMIPIAASMAVATQTSPYSFMIPATMACSCAFCLPIATPPNMVVFGTGRLPMREMNMAGVLLNVVGTVLLWGATYSIIPAVMGVGPEEFPSWAAQQQQP